MTRTHLLAGLAALALPAVARAALYDPHLEGIVETNQWANLGTENGYTSDGFGSDDLWTLPANAGGNATIRKLSGYAEMASNSIYYYFGSDPFDFTVPNTELVVGDATPVQGVATILLQFEIGNNGTATFADGVLPRLSYNGGAQDMAGELVRSDVVGTVPFGAFTGTITDYAIRYNVTGMGVTSFGIDWTGVNHDTLDQVRLDEATVSLVVPEPGLACLAAAGALFALGRPRRGSRP